MNIINVEINTTRTEQILNCWERAREKEIHKIILIFKSLISVRGGPYDRSTRAWRILATPLLLLLNKYFAPFFHCLSFACVLQLCPPFTSLFNQRSLRPKFSTMIELYSRRDPTWWQISHLCLRRIWAVVFLVRRALCTGMNQAWLQIRYLFGRLGVNISRVLVYVLGSRDREWIPFRLISMYVAIQMSLRITDTSA